MEASMFTDYYEILEISPNANSDTIERIFRYLAPRYHPDNTNIGDLSRFSEIVEAHNTLKDPVKRAVRPTAGNWLRKPATPKASNGTSSFRTSCCRFLMSNADKASTIPASASTKWKACRAVRASIWSFISGI
jgi:curved DNA-binding protein CbpA